MVRSLGVRGIWWKAPLAGVVLVGTACGSGGDDSSGATAADSALARPASGAAGEDSGGTLTVATGDQAATAAARELVVTADMTVVARDVRSAAAKAETMATERGGFVFGQEGSSSGDDSAVLTLKVPTPRYRDLLADLSGLGKEEQRNVMTDDVTEEGVDLDSRIASAQRSVDRVRGFLDETKNINELAGLEAELTRRETELEQLQGQRRVLDDQVALATITLSLNATPAPPPPAGDALRDVPGFGNALASGVNALIKIGRVLSAGAGYALPFLVVLGVPLFVWRRIRSRRRPTPPPAPAVSV